MINHISKAVMYATICLIKSHTSRHTPVSSQGSKINSPLFTSGNNWLTPLYFLFRPSGFRYQPLTEIWLTAWQETKLL